jgi:predicted nucleotidyltransferase
MQLPSPNPIKSLDNLRVRVERLLRARDKGTTKEDQIAFGWQSNASKEQAVNYPTKSIVEFLDFLSDALPYGDLYLFGGILRDLALLGRRGFSSDIDLVVEGEWSHCVEYLESRGARRNKFGGFRLFVAEWPVDIWNAEETWAIRQGLVTYRGIASLTETTVLNWDAILMNWRTRRFVHRHRYLEDISERLLDIVLEENPNPLGMVVRVFRHLCLKDARKITPSAAKYLAEATARYSYQEIKDQEVLSYGTSIIQQPHYRLFQCIDAEGGVDIGKRFGIATETLKRELGLFGHA